MRIQAERLRNVTATLFRAAGCATEEAECVARYLVEANLVGHDSHGVIRIFQYVNWMRQDRVRPGQRLQVLLETDNLLLGSGNYGLGQTIALEALSRGIEKAIATGVAVVALRETAHVGRLGDWAELCAAAGLVSLHFVNGKGTGTLVAPFGGIERRLSASPLAIGVPRLNQPPLVLDISTCMIAEGKLKVALNKGEKVPLGCILDGYGRPTNDPKDFYAEPRGALLPFGGHKGYGLNVMVELLAGALTGSGCSNPDTAGRLTNGMLSILIQPSSLSANGTMANEVEDFVEFVKSSQLQSPDGEILMPGELEMRTRAKRLANGIELDETTWCQVEESATLVGISPHDWNALLAEGD